MVTLTQSRLLSIYVTISAGLIGAITLLQYSRYNLFGSGLLLGWDSPRYVWAANEVIAKGPLSLIRHGSYPHLYVHLLAILGYITGSTVIIERILPLIFSTLLIYANARITLKITKNVHIAGLAAILTAISINTLRLFADLHRNLMVLSLSFTSFPLISNLIDQDPFTRKSLMNKTYPAIVAIFLILAATQLETFLVLALTTILIGVLSRNWRKLAALSFPPIISIAILLTLFPQLPQGYNSQLGLLTRELLLNEVILWTGGSWILFSFITAGALYVSYKALRRKDILASLVLFWTSIVALLFVLTVQRIIPLSTEYALRALLILPIPILFASAVFAFGSLLKDTFLEIGISSTVKRYAVRMNLRRVALFITASVLVMGSTAITSQHYDEFLTPYIPALSYDKIKYACQFLDENDLSKPIVVFYGEHSSWFTNLYNDYVRAEIGDHYFYKGDVGSLLQCYAAWSHNRDQIQCPHPIMLIAPYLYDKEIPYCLTPYHIGQGVYVIPTDAAIYSQTSYGPIVSVATESSIERIKSEYLYADQVDPSIIILRVTAGGHTSYTFEDYPSDWAFLKLEQGGDLSFPENNPRRLDGTVAEEGNDPAESVQSWSASQTGTISVDNSSAKEGDAGLKVEGFTDSWGNLGARYNSIGTWDLTTQPFLSVWAKADAETAFSITVTDVAGNTRTFWDLKPDGSSATTEWKRFAVNLSNCTSQFQSFDLSRADYVDFYVYSNPGKFLSFWIDDPVIDNPPTSIGAISKTRVHQDDLVALYFWARCG